MRIDSRDWEPPRTREALVTMAFVLLSALSAFTLQTTGLGLKGVLGIALAAVSCVFLLTQSRRLGGASSYLLIGSMLLGWRQIGVTNALKIHPSELIVWFAFVAMLLRLVVEKRSPGVRLPTPVGVLIVFMATGVCSAAVTGVPWDAVVAELKLFLVIVPIICVVQRAIRNPDDWRRSFLALGLVAIYISSLGLLEFYVPAAVQPLGGLFGERATITSQQGLVRADFSFYGGAITSALLSVLCVPLIAYGVAPSKRRGRITAVLAGLLCAFAVYASGSRGPFLALALSGATYIVLNLKRAWLLFAPAGLLLVVPATFYNNLAAAFNPTAFYDTSTLVRLGRFLGALELVRSGPLFGHGWAASGWVHSDLAQIAANLGLPALAVFLWWYLGLMWRLVRTGRRPSPDWPAASEYANGLAAGLVAGLVCLATEALIVLPHLIIPIWFLMALAGQLVFLNEQPQQAPIRARSGLAN
jgi:hypothetical protein